MPFVASDGTVHNEPPFMEKVKRFFTELWVIIVMFFKTLFGDNVTKGGNNYTRDYRGGGGGGGGGSGGPRGGSGPRPPQRRVGRIAGMSDIPCSPSGG